MRLETGFFEGAGAKRRHQSLIVLNHLLPNYTLGLWRACEHELRKAAGVFGCFGMIGKVLGGVHGDVGSLEDDGVKSNVLNYFGLWIR